MGISRDGLERTKKFIMGRDQLARKGLVRARTETLAGYNLQRFYSTLNKQWIGSDGISLKIRKNGGSNEG